jgi:hypothetical protein
MQKYQHHMSGKDKSEILTANRDACKYYAYICQFMFTYMFYAGMKIVFKGTIQSKSIADNRAFDILSIIISLSNMIMVYGVSD